MSAIPFLVCFPFVISVMLLFTKSEAMKAWVSYVGAAAVIALVGFLWFDWFQIGTPSLPLYRETETIETINHVIFGCEIVITCVVTFLCFKYKKSIISVLSVVPTAMIAYVEFCIDTPPICHMYIDKMTMLMTLIIGVIGSFIIIYAVGYMRGYHEHHSEVQNRSNYFLALLFFFMGAMFGFVFSESLLWLFFFWECTSVCSFLLIGYTRSQEAIDNSFRALWMNLFGGLALAMGILYFAIFANSISFRALIGLASEFVKEEPQVAVYVAIPISLMAFAALTKSAQLPFSTWLLGAMVAPTPSSALLHSATMVKAGVYVLLRLAPAMHGTVTGNMIALVGGFTFFVSSFMAIAQSDAKRVLAMSTVSNLGLMVACAGIGTTETVWAGTFLMIFHAVSKSLLFLDVGAVENVIHSRDIENMHGILYFLPQLAMFMFIGIAGMFLAPFGMLISKWAALRATVDEKNIILLLFIVFGSATTSFYWSKWMGKIIGYPRSEEKHKDTTLRCETIAMTVQAVLMILLCVLFPFISVSFVDPLIGEMFGEESTAVISQEVLYMLVIIICFVFAIPLITHFYSRNVQFNKKLAYMGGINVGDNNSFVDSFGESKQLWMSNYYFANKIGIRKIMLPCQFVTSAILIGMFCIVLGAVL